MANIKINYEEIITTISDELLYIKSSKSEYSSLTLSVSDEQMFAKEKEKSPNTIYVVVHFGDASTNMGQAILPVDLMILGAENKIDILQELLSDFVVNFNLSVDETKNSTQLYMSPVRTINFNEVNKGFRSLFNLTGTFVIGDNTIRLSNLTYFWKNPNYDPEDEESEEFLSEDIQVLSYDDVTENSMNPQAYPNTRGRTKSYASFQTFAFTIAIYADGSKQLCRDILRMKFEDTRSHQNDEFIFSGTFSNSGGFNMPRWTFKCRSADFTQRIGEIPAWTLTFGL